MRMFDHLKGRKLFRSPKEALVFGIAAGLAHYVQVDVVFVRLALVALAYVSGWWPMFLLYVVAVVLVPIDPAQDTVAPQQEPKDVTPTEHMDANQNM